MNQLILETLIVMMRAMLAHNAAELAVLRPQIAKCEAALATWGADTPSGPDVEPGSGGEYKHDPSAEANLNPTFYVSDVEPR